MKHYPSVLRTLLLSILTFCSYAGCSSHREPTQETRVVVGVVIQSEDASQVKQVRVVIEGADLSKAQTVMLKLEEEQWKGSFEQLQPGIARTFHATALNGEGEALYKGSTAPLNIAKGTTRVVLISLITSPQPLVFLNSFPEITSLTASSYQIGPGQTTNVSATVRDQEANEKLSYQWEGAGHFKSKNALKTEWSAPLKEGLFQLTFTVRDSQGAEATMSLYFDIKQEYLPTQEHHNGGSNHQISNSSRRSKGKAKVYLHFNKAPVICRIWAREGNIRPGAITQIHSVSFDPDGNIVRYQWSDSCGGAFHSPTSRNPTWKAPAQAPANKKCHLRLVVTDKKGGRSRGVLQVWVGFQTKLNISPQILSNFQSDDRVQQGKVVVLRVTTKDPEETPLRIHWYALGQLSNPKNTIHSTGTTSEVKWIAPKRTGIRHVWAVIWDASGARTIECFAIRVTQ